jgi:hypothetical protein
MTHGTGCLPKAVRLILFWSIGVSLPIAWVVPHANGSIVVSHTGSNDPQYETPAWSPSGVAAAVNDQGTPAWKIMTGMYRESYYAYSLGAADVSDGWTLTARARVVQAEDCVGWAVAFGVNFPLNDVVLGLVGDENSPNPENDGLWVYSSQKGWFLYHAMDTADRYHTYQVVYDAAKPLAPYGMFVDGEKVGDLSTSDFLPNPEPNSRLVTFGSASAGSWYSEANWNYVAFEAGLNAVPEPGTILVWSLLGGFSATIGWWRRK